MLWSRMQEPCQSSEYLLTITSLEGAGVRWHTRDPEQDVLNPVQELEAATAYKNQA